MVGTDAGFHLTTISFSCFLYPSLLLTVKTTVPLIYDHSRYLKSASVPGSQ